MAIANKTDVVAAFRALTPAEEAVVPNWLELCEAELASKVTGLRERFDAASGQAGADFQTLVIGTIIAPVIRVLRNPEGWRSVQLDDGGFTRDKALSSGLLKFEDFEINRLQPHAALGGAYVVGLGG